MAEVLIPESGSKKGIYLKILAEIDLAMPLLKGSKLKFNGKELWVDFKYENLAMFYFYCGRVGHQERNCWVRKGDTNSGTILKGQYGDWLKADIRRVGSRQHNQGVPERPKENAHD